MSTTDDPLKPARDAAFLKLGRNIALFQQLEAALKTFYESLVVEGSSSEDAERRRVERSEVLSTTSLGLVVKKVFKELTVPGDDDIALPGVAGGMHFRFRFCSAGLHVEERRSAMEALIDARNQLIHHLNRDFDLRSADGIAALDELLDPQADRIRDELRAWQELFEQNLEGRRAAAEWLASPEFRESLELQLLWASPLIRGLMQLADELKRNDGWTSLSHASGVLRQRDGTAFDNLKARHGHAKVKPVLLASGLFELREEATARGGVRVLYRPRNPEEIVAGIEIRTV